MRESHMRHLSRARLTLTILANFNHRKVNVIVNVHVLYSDSQARRVTADIAWIKLKIMHHF